MISKDLLDILVCPVCKGTLEYDEEENVLICRESRLKFPIEDDIPIMLPVREAGVKYLKPAFYDDVLTVVTSIKRKPGVRVFIEYEIMREGETIATGFTEHVFTDNGLHPVKPPKTMLDRLSETWQKKVVHDGEEP